MRPRGRAGLLDTHVWVKAYLDLAMPLHMGKNRFRSYSLRTTQISIFMGFFYSYLKNKSPLSFHFGIVAQCYPFLEEYKASVGDWALGKSLFKAAVITNIVQVKRSCFIINNSPW